MNDSVSNTLFRFVSLRSVQLPDSQSVTNKFVQIPLTMVGKGVFYDAIKNKPSSMTKYEAMNEASQNFKGAIESVDQLSKKFEKVYGFSQWLAQNKSTASAKEISTEAQNIPKLTTLEGEELWNNVFFSVNHSTRWCLERPHVRIAQSQLSD